MSGKRPIELKRNSAFSGTVGVDGEGSIKEFFNIGRTLLMIKEEAIYKFQLADQVDPDRANINVPHVQRKLYSVGESSEVVGRILLTGKYLFEKGMLDRRFDKAVLLSAVLDFFDEVIAAVAVFENLKAEQDVAVATFEKQKAEETTLLLPSVPDIRGKVKSFIQRAEHSIQRLLALCQIFYPMPVGTAWFDSFVKAAETAHALDQAELDQIRAITKYAQFVRHCRHCVEHPKANQKLVVSDFKMTAAAAIDPPMIEVVHQDTPEPTIPLVVFMHGMLASIIAAGEELMAFLASRHMELGWQDKAVVFNFPEEQRRHPHVRFYFAMNMGGTMVPVG